MRLEKIVILVVAVLVLGAGGYYLKWGLPMSDYQRLNAVEHRLDQLEEKTPCDSKVSWRF